MLIKGSQLTQEQRKAVFNAYIMRWTSDNPRLTEVYHCGMCNIRNPYVNIKSSEGHTHPTMPLQTDEQWLNEHAFYVRSNGELDSRFKHCEPAFLADHV